MDPNVFCDRGLGPQSIDRKLDVEAKESHGEASHAATVVHMTPSFTLEVDEDEDVSVSSAQNQTHKRRAIN